MEQVDTARAAYEKLSQQNTDLLIWLKTRMSEGVKAETVKNWATWRFADAETARLVIGAAHYIERYQAE